MKKFQSTSELFLVKRQPKKAKLHSSKHLPNLSRQTVCSVNSVREKFENKYKNYLDSSLDEQKIILINFWYEHVAKIEQNLQSVIKIHENDVRIKFHLQMLLKIFYIRWTFLENVILRELHNNRVDLAALTVMVAVTEILKFFIIPKSMSKKRKSHIEHNPMDGQIKQNVRTFLKTIYK